MLYVVCRSLGTFAGGTCRSAASYDDPSVERFLDNTSLLLAL